jgi:hypothetical protein
MQENGKELTARRLTAIGERALNFSFELELMFGESAHKGEV